MKKLFISDLKTINENITITIYGWIASMRSGKTKTFFDVVDSTGKVQVIADSDFGCKKEESVCVTGTVCVHNDDLEIKAVSITTIGKVELQLDPSPRCKFDVFSSDNADKVLSNRHLYLRNEKLIAAMKARNAVTRAVREWFDSENYYEITAPILCPVILYDEETAIKTDFENSDHNVFLTQCVGFYLESAVHALEKVYNIGPSFRAQETSSKRHLNEYWHVKSECAFCAYDEFFAVVENMLAFVTQKVEACSDELCAILGTKFDNAALKTPFQRITYTDALALLEKRGISIPFGKSINARGEKCLAEYFGAPVWVTRNPAHIEGFPYRYCEDDKRLTMTADLIWHNNHGELLGIAEKITDPAELRARLAEKGKDKNADYEWFVDLRRVGTIPHCGMGMGLERLIKCLFNLNHVRDAIPFPRSIGRKIYP
ncbi:MAG: hypothetical protein J1G01_02825 [Clostridiales bacterium]|nr:hypothetical protein [Clostridiales bacterium]